MFWRGRKRKGKKIRPIFTTFKCKTVYKYRYALPQNEYTEKPIPPVKIWKYFLSLLRSCGELWLQQTWEMTVVIECLWKGLFCAKELSWFGIKSKRAFVSLRLSSSLFSFGKAWWGSAAVVSSSITPHPGGHYGRLYCVNWHVGNLAIFEDWN